MYILSKTDIAARLSMCGFLYFVFGFLLQWHFVSPVTWFLPLLSSDPSPPSNCLPVFLVHLNPLLR